MVNGLPANGLPGAIAPVHDRGIAPGDATKAARSMGAIRHSMDASTQHSHGPATTLSRGDLGDVAGSAPPIDQQRVDAVRDALVNGRFVVAPAKIADALLAQGVFGR